MNAGLGSRVTRPTGVKHAVQEDEGKGEGVAFNYSCAAERGGCSLGSFKVWLSLLYCTRVIHSVC